MIDTRIMTTIDKYIEEKKTIPLPFNDIETTLNLGNKLELKILTNIQKFINEWKKNFEAIKTNYDEQKLPDYKPNPVTIVLNTTNISDLRPKIIELHRMAFEFFNESFSVIPVVGETYTSFYNTYKLNFVNAIICLKYLDPTSAIPLKISYEAIMEKNQNGGWWSKINEELETNNINLEIHTGKKKRNTHVNQSVYQLYTSRPQTPKTPKTKSRPGTASTHVSKSPRGTDRTRRRGGNKNSLYNVIMRKSLKNKTM